MQWMMEHEDIHTARSVVSEAVFRPDSQADSVWKHLDISLQSMQDNNQQRTSSESLARGKGSSLQINEG